jgi:uncharacterized Zn finger protein
MTRLMKTKHGRAVQVYVRSAKSTAKLHIRLYSAKGVKIGDAAKTVRTNRVVRVAGVHVDKRATSVKATVLD